MVRPTALYVHVPFCSRVCPYCAFAVTSKFDDAMIQRFLRAIDTELRALDSDPALPLETVFIGGGTPTVLGPKEIATLLESVARRIVASEVREWTVEMNPETVDLEKARIMLDAGVTRASLGAQSMDERFLRQLGRTHSADDVRRSVRILREAGFEELNIDLIYAQEGQTVSDWMSDIEAVLELGIDHLSLYELTFEAGTPFGRAQERGSMTRAPDTLAVAMFSEARARLAQAGIEWYEVSNFATPGHESKHNQTYWRNGPYFGVGPGAFGCVSGTRTTNAADVADWASRVEATGSGVVERDVLSARDTFIETLLAGLRTRLGVDLAELKRRTLLDVRETHGTYIDDLAAKGLAECSPDRLRLTLRGVLLLDSILLGFLDQLDGGSDPARGVA